MKKINPIETSIPANDNINIAKICPIKSLNKIEIIIKFKLT